MKRFLIFLCLCMLLFSVVAVAKQGSDFLDTETKRPEDSSTTVPPEEAQGWVRAEICEFDAEELAAYNEASEMWTFTSGGYFYYDYPEFYVAIFEGDEKVLACMFPDNGEIPNDWDLPYTFMAGEYYFSMDAKNDVLFVFTCGDVPISDLQVYVLNTPLEELEYVPVTSEVTGEGMPIALEKNAIYKLEGSCSWAKNEALKMIDDGHMAVEWPTSYQNPADGLTYFWTFDNAQEYYFPESYQFIVMPESFGEGDEMTLYVAQLPELPTANG